MTLEIMAASDAHLRDLAENLRPLDRREIVTLGFANPLDGIIASAAASRWVKAAVDAQGRVAAVWGVGHYDDPLGDGRAGHGGPWLLSTKQLSRHKKTFLRQSRQEIGFLKQEYRSLSGLVDGRYSGAVRWIRWLGFSMEPFQEIGGAPFLRFTWVRED